MIWGKSCGFTRCQKNRRQKKGTFFAKFHPGEAIFYTSSELWVGGHFQRGDPLSQYVKNPNNTPRNSGHNEASHA